jgi:hypothetical protein
MAGSLCFRHAASHHNASFRGVRQGRTNRNPELLQRMQAKLEIPGSPLTRRPGMTVVVMRYD